MEWFEGGEWKDMKKKLWLSPNSIWKYYCGFKKHHWPCHLSSPLLDTTCLCSKGNEWKKWLMLKQKYKILQFSSLLFSSLHPSHFDLCLTDVLFICGHGPEMKRDWWLSGGNAEQSLEPIWTSGNGWLLLPSIIFSPNDYSLQGTYGSPLMKLGANKKICKDTGNRHEGKQEREMRRWREGERKKHNLKHLSRMPSDSTCPPSTMIILPQCGQWTDMPPLIPLPPVFLSSAPQLPLHHSLSVCGLSVSHGFMTVHMSIYFGLHYESVTVSVYFRCTD